MKSIKVGIGFLRGSINKISGDASDVHSLSEGFLRYNVEVIVFSCNTKKTCWKKSDYVPSYTVDYYCNSDWSLLQSFVILFKFIKYIRLNSSKFDIIQFHFPTPIMVIVTDIVKLFTIKPIITNVGGATLGDSKKILPLVKKSFLRYILRYLMSTRIINRIPRYNGEMYIVPSNYQREKLVSIGLSPERIRVIPNAIILPASNDNKMNKRSGSYLKNTEYFKIGYLGHFTANKGVEILLMAFMEINRVMPNSKLVLAWSGVGDKGKIVKFINKLSIKDKVEIIGEVDSFLFLDSLDVLALPYLNEIGTHWYPHSLLEAMVTGTPIVTSSFEIIKELIGNTKAAILTEPGNVEQVSKSIMNLSANLKLVHEIVRDQRKIINKFGSDEVAKQYIKVYKEILDGQKR